MDMNEYRPLLYFLKECDHIRDVYVDNEFINEDDIKLLKNSVYVPRTAEHIWIYQKITEIVKTVNSSYFNFQLSGFNSELERFIAEDWVLTLVKGQASTNKLNVVLFTGAGTLHMNHGEYTVECKEGGLAIFPSFLWFKVSGDNLYCTVSGDHFR